MKLKPERYIYYQGRVYYLDLHSTILSRRNGYHYLCGNLRYIHPVNNSSTNRKQNQKNS